MKSSNVVWHEGAITKEDREKYHGHRGITLWFTGLPCSGKSTLAVEVERRLHAKGCHTYILDGDNIRHGLNSNLGFSPADREENIRRIGETAKLFRDAGSINLVAFISPYRRDRERARALAEPGTFIEVFCDCSLSECIRRDTKGQYQKAQQGLIKDFTGISAPYEEPELPELPIPTDVCTVEQCATEIIDYLMTEGLIC